MSRSRSAWPSTRAGRWCRPRASTIAWCRPAPCSARALHFQKACELVRSGELGKVTFVRTWNYGNMPEEGIGNPPDEAPPAGLDWDMWLGPGARSGLQRQPLRRRPERLLHFRWFWDYAGGMMTDWGVHWSDIVQMAFDETMPPTQITALGGKYLPEGQSRHAGYAAGHLRISGASSRPTKTGYGNRQSMFEQERRHSVPRLEGHAVRRPARATDLVPEKGSSRSGDGRRAESNGNMRALGELPGVRQTREKPTSDIEKCHRSTTTCLLGNVALRSKLRLDWDVANLTVKQAEAKPLLKREYRKPWKLTV